MLQQYNTHTGTVRYPYEVQHAARQAHLSDQQVQRLEQIKNRGSVVC